MALLKATLAPPSSSSSSSPSSLSSSPSPLSSLSSSSSVSFGQGKHGHRSPPQVRFSAGFTPTLYQGHQSITRPSIKSFGTIKETIGSLTDVEGLRFAMVVGRFNEFISKALLSGALEAFKRHGIKDEDMEVVWVPGSFEIPIVAQTLAKSGKFDAILCIGVVIRGDTTHYDEVANAATSGVLSAGLNSGVPCIFGVLTCETLDQAINRAGGKAGNKGAEAAITAIEMATLFKHHLKDLASSETKSTCVSISV